MTILLGAWRNDWAILAADRRAAGRQPNGTWLRAMHVKVVCHKTLPLAFASSGMGSLNNRSTSSYLQEFAASIDAADLSTKDPFILKLFKYLYPLVEDERDHPCYPGEEDKRVLGVCLGWVHNGSAEFGQLVIDLEANNYDSAQYYIGASDEILQMYGETFGNYDAVIGQHIQEPQGLAAHFRNVINLGAQAERDQKKNRCLTTGGLVDVAVVDVNGARRI